MQSLLMSSPPSLLDRLLRVNVKAGLTVSMSVRPYVRPSVQNILPL